MIRQLAHGWACLRAPGVQPLRAAAAIVIFIASIVALFMGATL